MLSYFCVKNFLLHFLICINQKFNRCVCLVSSSLDNINIYVGSDKKLHFVDKDGADSVLPFSNMKYITYRIYNDSSPRICVEKTDSEGNKTFYYCTYSQSVNKTVSINEHISCHFADSANMWYVYLYQYIPFYNNNGSVLENRAFSNTISWDYRTTREFIVKVITEYN